MIIYVICVLSLGAISGQFLRTVTKNIIDYYVEKTSKSRHDSISVELHKVHRYPDTDEIDFINAVVYTGFSSKEELLIFIEENIIIREYDYFISKEVIDLNSMEEQD
ncbi:MAG: hypothetical protein AB4057_13950 [Crocosphaera sp.]